VFELAVRLAVRAVGTDTSSIKTGRSTKECKNYLKHLGRLKSQGNDVEFFRVLRNAQNKLTRFASTLVR
jgi:hypothetical protein